MPLNKLPKLQSVDFKTTGFDIPSDQFNLPTKSENGEDDDFGLGDIVGGVGSFAAAVARAIPRGAGSIYATLAGKDQLRTDTAVEEFLYGNEPVRDIEGTGKNFLTTFGAAEETADEYGFTTGLALVGLDLLPLGWGAGKIATKAVKNVGKETAKTLATKYGNDAGAIIANMGDDIAKKAVEKEFTPLTQKVARNLSDSSLFYEARQSKNVNEFAKTFVKEGTFKSKKEAIDYYNKATKEMKLNEDISNSLKNVVVKKKVDEYGKNIPTYKITNSIPNPLQAKYADDASQAARVAKAAPATKGTGGDALIKTKTAKSALKELPDDIKKPLVSRWGTRMSGAIADVGGTNFAKKALIKGNEDEVLKVVNVDENTSLIAKLEDLLREDITPLKAKKEELISLKRPEQTAAGKKAFDEAIEAGESTQEAQATAKTAMKGSLQEDLKLGEGTIKLSQGESDRLFKMINEADFGINVNYADEDFWMKMHARDGLGKLVRDKHWVDTGDLVPNQTEINSLKTIFGNEMGRVAQEAADVLSGVDSTTLKKVGENTVSVLNIPKSLMASFDMSAVMRQGFILSVTKPRKALKNFKEMFKYWKNDDYFKAAMNEIENGKYANLQKASKLSLSKVGKGTKLTEQEEAFMSNLTSYIPGIKQSEKAFVGFLNKMRVDTFNEIAEEYMKGGIDPTQNMKVFKDLANFINTASGKMSLGSLESAVPVANLALFSPRFLASRMQMFNPVFYMKMSKPVRKLAARSMLKFTGTNLAVLGGLKMLWGDEAEVGADPRSSNFAKFRIGKARWDMWGGFQQYLVLASRLMTDESISSTTGELKELQDGEVFSRKAIMERFLEGKFSPPASLATDLLRGQNFIGEDVTLGGEAYNKLLPLYFQDLVEVLKDEEYTRSVGVGVPAFFGVGAQYYDAPDVADVDINNNIFGTPHADGQLEYGDLGIPNMPGLDIPDIPITPVKPLE